MNGPEPTSNPPVPRRRGTAGVCLAGALLFLGGGAAVFAQGDGLPRGCTDMPYVRYEAESGTRSGGAADRTAFDFNPALTASEASGRHYVGLPDDGAYVEWAVTNTGNGATLRFTLPDNATGDGVAGSLAVDVNGTNVLEVQLSSYWAWTYFVSSNPRNTPGVRPRMRFDEVHFGLPQALQPGDVLRIRKANGDPFEYGIDFLELEDVPAVRPPAPGLVSVTDYGADGGDSDSDLAAFDAAWHAARTDPGIAGIYLPPGRYVLPDKWELGHSTGLTIQGAGIWHTELFFSTKAVGAGGIAAGDNTAAIDIGHFFMGSVLNERYIEPGTISDYKAFNGTFGANSTIHDLWIAHFETGAWLADESAPVNVTSNLGFERNRVRGTYADGINFSQGTRDSVVRQCSFRDNGDDAMAVWPSSRENAPEGQGNVFHHNTVEFTCRAGGVGIFGGFGHEVHHNIIRGGVGASGIRFSEDFSGYHFANNTSIRIYENTLSGRGTSLDLWNRPRGAIEIAGAGIRHLHFDHNDILDSPRHAIQLRGGQDLVFSNTVVQATGLDGHNAPGGAAIRQYDLGGSATFVYLLMSDIEHDPPVIQEVPAYNLTVLSQYPFTESSTVTVPEGGTADLGVRLSFAPAGVVTVTVERIAGDADLTVAAGAALSFGPSDWDVFQPVTFAAADDPDAIAGEAVFRCAALGHGETVLTATEFDDDINHPPVAANDTAAIQEDTSVAVAVLANDHDPEDDPLALASVSPGAHGAVVRDGDQAVYTPNAGFHGQDAFTYIVEDGRGGSATGRVDVTVAEVVTPNPYRMDIDFPGYDRAGILTNFPVLVRLGPLLAGFAYNQFASPLGHDLRFADAAGTVLNYEVDTWNPGGDSAVWVQVPAFSNGCRIEASWGSSDNLDPPDSTTNGAVWSEGYAAVYHAGGAGLERRDSTAGARHGQAYGNTVPDSGRVGAADRFDGDEDYVELPSTFVLFNGLVPVTVEFWFHADALAPGTDWQTSPVLFQGNGESAWMITLGDSIPGDAIGHRVDQGEWLTPVWQAGLETGRWYHCTSAYRPDGTGNWRLHLDGAPVAEATRTGLIGFLKEKNLYGGNDVGTDRWFDGVIDELRISSVTRSSNWIWASWMSVASNESFTAVEPVAGPPPPETTILIDFGHDGSYRGVSVAVPDPNGNHWNSLAGPASNLVDTAGAATAVGLEITTAFGTDSYNGPSGPTSDPPTPGEIAGTVIDPAALGLLGITNAAFDYINGTDRHLVLNGLDPGRTVRLTFYAAHKYSDDDTTVFSVHGDGGYSNALAAAGLAVQDSGAPEHHNSNAVAVLTGLLPQADQALYVAFTGAAGNAGYLNALQLDIYPAPTNGSWTLATAAGPGGSVGGDSNGLFAAGSTVTVSASAAAYYHWGQWTGDVPGGSTTNNPLELVMDRDRTVTAHFAENLAVHQTPEWWLAGHGWTNDFDAAALADTDLDGHPAWKERIAGTDPTDSNSVLAVATVAAAPGSDAAVLSWPGATGRFYRLLCRTNLQAEPMVCASNLPAGLPVSVHTQDITGLGRWFFAVGVEE